METAEQIRETLRSYILSTFLPDENPSALTDTTPLVTGGILDSLATLKLVSFMEDRYKIELQAHEVDVDNLDTISKIVTLITGKVG